MMQMAQAQSLDVVACRMCGQAVPRSSSVFMRCTRCRSIVTPRVANSAEKTLAWLITGVVLYLPANLMPVMHTSSIHGEEDSTIFGGILDFWEGGSWDIAALIFVASVAVPVTKFLSLALLLWTAQHNSTWAQRERTKLYRLVEFIGYWSMLDVVVVAITCSILKFKGLATAEPQLGILFFCGVVIATMISAMSFDPRLIWDPPARPR